MSPSRVTSHLANERTFLAWLRTAIAMMGFGVVIVRLRYLAPNAAIGHGLLHATQIGLLFAFIALGMVGFALLNFFYTRQAIERDSYITSATGIVIFAAAILVLGIAVVMYLLTAAPLPAAGAAGF